MKRRAAVVAAAAVVALGPGTTRAAGERDGTRAPAAGVDLVPIDRVVAVLDAAPGDAAAGAPAIVTDRALDAEVRLLLAQRGDPVAPEGPLPAAVRASVLDEIVAETVLAAEARRLDVFVAPEPELRAAREAIERRLGRARLDAVLAGAGFDAADLDAILTRRAAAAHFIDEEVRPTVTVTEAEIRDAHAAGGGAGALDAGRETIRAALGERGLRERVARLVETLRERARVRILLSR